MKKKRKLILIETKDCTQLKGSRWVKTMVGSELSLKQFES